MGIKPSFNDGNLKSGGLGLHWKRLMYFNEKYHWNIKIIVLCCEHLFQSFSLKKKYEIKIYKGAWIRSKLHLLVIRMCDHVQPVEKIQKLCNLTPWITHVLLLTGFGDVPQGSETVSEVLRRLFHRVHCRLAFPPSVDTANGTETPLPP